VRSARPSPGIRSKLIDEDGQILKAGETGEIAVKGFDPVMFLEYWNDPAATDKKFLGDWLRTGDYAKKDEEGYFWFVGRQDDIIESGGYRIGPGEIEDCLMKHPAVALVGVIGVPDPLRGEIVKAFIVPNEGVTVDPDLEEVLKQYVKTRLEAHAYPREIQFLKDMPKTSSGKILRQDLRKIHQESRKEKQEG
jgi:acetyl-CoA synthetase